MIAPLALGKNAQLPEEHLTLLFVRRTPATPSAKYGSPSVALASSTRRSTTTPLAAALTISTMVAPGIARIPEPGVAHVSVTFGVVTFTSAVTPIMPFSAIVAPGLAAANAAANSPSVVTTKTAAAGHAVGTPRGADGPLPPHPALGAQEEGVPPGARGDVPPRLDRDVGAHGGVMDRHARLDVDRRHDRAARAGALGHPGPSPLEQVAVGLEQRVHLAAVVPPADLCHRDA